MLQENARSAETTQTGQEGISYRPQTFSVDHSSWYRRIIPSKWSFCNLADFARQKTFLKLFLARGRRDRVAVDQDAGNSDVKEKGKFMNDLTIPRGAEPRKLLQSVIEEEIPAIMSYLSRGKWHVAKIIMRKLGASRLNVLLLQGDKPHPVNIQENQPVGVSLKYRYGKVVFDSKVTGFEQNGSEAEIVLLVPDRVEIIQRRSYFRVNVPSSLKVNVILWHRQHDENDNRKAPDKYWQGKLMDISAGGLQVAMDNSTNPDFRKGQFVTMRFTALPYQQPLMFNAQIRNTLDTADGTGTCLGMQIVGLEASPEGQETLQRLCSVVEEYYQVNQSSAKQRDTKAVN